MAGYLNSAESTLGTPRFINEVYSTPADCTRRSVIFRVRLEEGNSRRQAPHSAQMNFCDPSLTAARQTRSRHIATTELRSHSIEPHPRINTAKTKPGRWDRPPRNQVSSFISLIQAANSSVDNLSYERARPTSTRSFLFAVPAAPSWAQLLCRHIQRHSSRLRSATRVAVWAPRPDEEQDMQAPHRILIKLTLCPGRSISLTQHWSPMGMLAASNGSGT